MFAQTSYSVQVECLRYAGDTGFRAAGLRDRGLCARLFLARTQELRKGRTPGHEPTILGTQDRGKQGERQEGQADTPSARLESPDHLAMSNAVRTDSSGASRENQGGWIEHVCT